MGDLLTTIDVVIFFGSLIAVMGIGLWAGRKEDTSAEERTPSEASNSRPRIPPSG